MKTENLKKFAGMYKNIADEKSSVFEEEYTRYGIQVAYPTSVKYAEKLEDVKTAAKSAHSEKEFTTFCNECGC